MRGLLFRVKARAREARLGPRLRPFVRFGDTPVGSYANGIVPAGRRYVLVIGLSTGVLGRVDLESGRVRAVKGINLPAGDGLAITGHTLYGVNSASRVTQVKLSRDWLRGSTQRQITARCSASRPPSRSRAGACSWSPSQFDRRGMTPACRSRWRASAGPALPWPARSSSGRRAGPTRASSRSGTRRAWRRATGCPGTRERFEAVELNSSFYAVPDRNTVHGWVEVDARTASPSTSRCTGCCRATRRRSTRCRRTCATGVEANGRGRVVLTPELEPALAAAAGRGDRAARRGRQARRLPAPADAGLRARAGTSSTSSTRLVEALAPHRWRSSSATAAGSRDERRERDARLVRRPRRRLRLRRRPARRPLPDHALGLDAVTRDDLAYLRLHGRNTDGYLTRQARSPSASAGATRTTSSRRSRQRARGLAEQAGEVHVAFNNNRDDDAPTAAQRFRALLGQAPAGEEQLTL